MSRIRENVKSRQVFSLSSFFQNRKKHSESCTHEQTHGSKARKANIRNKQKHYYMLWS